ncbi:MAG: hydrogenase maturation protease [Anaerolineae bacterium]
MDRILAIGYGNPGRLDDGLGPALAEILEHRAVPGVTVEAAYQLSVEDAAAIAEHDAVVFLDASVAGPEPFYFTRVEPGDGVELGFTTHSVEPAALLALARDLFASTAEGFVLGVRGYEFNDFGEDISQRAASNLAAAAQFITTALESRSLGESADRAAALGEGAPWQTAST